MSFSKTTATATLKTLLKKRALAWCLTPPGQCSLITMTTVWWTCWSRNVGVYTSNEKGHDGEYVGLKDAFLGHLYPERFEYPVLYKNLGHYKFKDVTAEVGLKPYGWCGDATFADVNGDGWPDLFFLNMQGASHYFENVEGKKFVEKTQEYFPRTPREAWT